MSFSNRFVIFSASLLFLQSCFGPNFEFKPLPSSLNGGANGEEKFSSEFFLGLDSVTEITDSTARLSWPEHPNATGFVILIKRDTWEVYDYLSSDSTSYQLTRLLPSENYILRVRMLDREGLPDKNEKDISFRTDDRPEMPSSLRLISPTSSPGLAARPVLEVAGVKAGDEVNLFTDSSCSTQVASATASGTTVQLSSNSLDQGSWTFYANAVGETGVSSLCSSASATYVRQICPNGYVEVPGNSVLGTSSFCVMQYEAKAWLDANDNGIIDTGEIDSDGCGEAGCSSFNWGLADYAPISTPEGAPWRRITGTASWSACDSLNSETSREAIDSDQGNNGTYALISNPEWMTIARNIELVADNWTGGGKPLFWLPEARERWLAMAVFNGRLGLWRPRS